MSGTALPHKVIICGNSLFLMAIEASLFPRLDLVVIQLSPRLPTLLDQVAALKPAIVLVERHDAERDVALTFALIQQGWPLLELDARQGRAQLFLGQEVALREPRALTHLIGQITRIQQSALISVDSIGLPPI